jgi:hypothetical protein
MLSICGFLSISVLKALLLFWARHHINVCVVKPYGILKVKNALVRSTYYVKEHICVLVTFWGYNT